jgi:hypothetical protein
MLSSSVEGHQCFGGNCCLLPSLTLKMEAAISSKMLVSGTKVHGVTSQKTVIVTHYAYMICKFLGSCSSAVYGSVLLGYGIMSMGLCRHIPKEQKYPDKISLQICCFYIYFRKQQTHNIPLCKCW